MDNINVIYVAGTGRSGSTVFDRVLGTLDGVTSFNEIYRMMSDGLVRNDRCACGENFRACPFWVEIVGRTFAGPEHEQHITRLFYKFDRTRQFVRIFTGAAGTRYKAELDEFRGWLRTLYFSLAEVSGSSVIIDSSKVPTRSLILTTIPGINVHVVHLVRDARAVVHSWHKEKFNPAFGQPLPRFGTLRTVSFWYARNFFTEMLRYRAPYSRVRYEDFVARPRSALARLIDDVGPLAGKHFDFVDDDSLVLSKLHSIGGNPDRFTTGVTKLRPDISWQSKLARSNRLAVSVMAYPMLRRYGYVGRAAAVPSK